MMFSALRYRGEANVASGLPSDVVAILAEEGGELLAADVARQLHTGITSSLTR